MKVLALASCFLALVVVSVQSKTLWEDILDSILSLDDSWNNNAEEDIDLGNGNFIGVRSFNDPSEEEEQEEEEETEEEEDEMTKKERREAQKKRREALRKQESLYATEDGDYIGHDCLNIKDFTEENWNAEPWNKGAVKRNLPTVPKGKLNKQPDRIYVKYNSAYGIPMVGTDKFSDDAMKRGCYLIRYIFADNQHMRIAARREEFYNVGYNGGVCCPPQMNTDQLACPCDGKFPQLGKGAPAHEMAHKFIKYLLTPMVWDGRMKMPEYVDPYGIWNYTDAYAVEGVKCNFKDVPSLVKYYGDFYTWVWNSQRQDRVRKTTICPCKMHHYMIYSGQEKWLFQGNKRVMERARKCFRDQSPNLYNLMETIFPCSNFYVPVCKDASYGFKLGAAQNFTIGKAEDPNDISKMNCKIGLDKAEVTPEEVPEADQPTEDAVKKKTKCWKVAQTVDEDLAAEAKKKGRKFPVNGFAKYLKNDEEHAWWLRRCCAKTLKFDNTVPPPKEGEGEELEDKPCKGKWITSEEEVIKGGDFD